MDNTIWDCVVVGGGPSGMMAAITAARRGIKVLLLEHKEMVGKKLLSTGNGKCNLTNENMNADCYYSSDKQFVAACLDRFGYADTIRFFEEIGVYTKTMRDCVYPVTMQATTVRTAMENQLYYSGVERICNFNINKINKNNDLFEIISNDKKIKARQIILATGLKAAPATGSDGSGIEFCTGFGLKVNKVLPSLTQLQSDSRLCKLIGNIRNFGIARLFINDEFICENEGELQFTDYGLSGIPIFQISHKAVKACEDGGKVTICLDLAPFMEEEQLSEFIYKGIANYPGMNIITYLSGIICNKVAIGIAVNSGLKNDGIALRKLDETTIKLIIKSIKKLEFNINGYRGYDSAQVCQGGVDLSELNNNFETKKIQGLYVIGELADVDGICGGYNLQWAFSSGYIAGMSVK